MLVCHLLTPALNASGGTSPIGECPECPSPNSMVFPGTSTGNPAENPPEELEDPPFDPSPGSPAYGDPGEPPGADQCQCCACWSPEAEQTLDCGGCSEEVDCTGDGCKPTNPTCADIDEDGECDYSDPDADASDTVGDDALFGDEDGDGIFNAIDLWPTGGAPINEAVALPEDLDLLKEIFADSGVGEEFFDLMESKLGAPHTWDSQMGAFTDGYLTAGEVLYLGSTTVDSLLSDLAALQQSFGDSLSLAEVGQLLSELESLHGYSASLGNLAAQFDDDFYGGAGNKGGYLNTIANLTDDLSVAVQAVDLQLGMMLQTVPEAILAIQVAAQAASIAVQFSVGLAAEFVAPGLGTSFFLALADGTEAINVEIPSTPGTNPPDNPGSTPDVPCNADSKFGDPVDMHSGQYDYHAVDLSVPGRGLPLVFERFYNSRGTRAGFVGRNWNMPLVETFAVFWDDGVSNTMDVNWGDGSHSYFVDSGSGFQGRYGEFGKARPGTPQFEEEVHCGVVAGSVIVRKPNGLLYYFCPPTIYVGLPGMNVAWLHKIADSDGNAIVIRRDGTGRPYEVVDTLGRTYQIEFDKDQNLLTSITDPLGRVVTYEYDLATTFDATSSPIFGGILTPIGDTPVPQVRSKNLLTVHRPETLCVDDSTTVVKTRPVEQYTYHENPNGYSNDPEPFLNHNLWTVRRNGQLFIEIQYYTDDPEAWEFDRVREYTLNGEITRFSYESVGPGQQNLEPGNPYGQTIHHATTVRHPDGALERYSFDEDGRLLRSETREFRDLDGDFVEDNVVPGGEMAWVRLYDYFDEDYLLTSTIDTTERDYPIGRETAFDYDLANGDRFQQGNLIAEHRFHERDVTLPPLPAETHTRSTTYDAFTARPATETDEEGRVTQYTYGHQEYDLSAFQASLIAAGWGVAFEPSRFGKDDVNLDTNLGGSHGRILIEYPTALVADSDPTLALTTVTPVTRRHLNSRGQTTFEITPDGVEVHTTYEEGLPVREEVGPPTSPHVDVRDFDEVGRMIYLHRADDHRFEYRYDARDNLIEVRHHPKQAPPSTGGGSGGSTPIDDTEVPDDLVAQSFFDITGRSVGERTPFYSQHGEDNYPVGLQPALPERRRYNGTGDVVAVERRLDYAGASVSGTATYEYDGRGLMRSARTPSSTTDNGASTKAVVLTLTRDPRGLVTRVDRANEDGVDFGFIEKSYNAYGEEISTQFESDDDGDGVWDRHTRTYDGFGRVVSETNEVGTSLIVVLDRSGRVLEERTESRNGVTVRHRIHTHDDWGRRWRTVTHNLELFPNGTTSPLTFATTEHFCGWGSGRGRLLWKKIGSGVPTQVEHYEYDDWGRRTALWHGLGMECGKSQELDPSGRIVSITSTLNDLQTPGPRNPSEVTTTYEFDDYGRVIAEMHPDGTSTTIERDARGLPVVVEDAANLVTTIDYDSLGNERRRQQVGEDGTTRVVHSRYDVEGNLVSMTDGKGQTTTFTYDALSRRTGRTLPDGVSSDTVQYDLRGRPFLENRMGGITVSRDFDPAGRTRMVLATSPTGPDVQKNLYYDALGNLNRAVDTTGSQNPITVFRRFSSEGWITYESLLDGAVGTARSFEVDYDEGGRASEITYPSGSSFEFIYDDAGRLDQVFDGSGQLLADYVRYGRYGVRRATLSGSADFLQDYDSRGRVTSSVTKIGRDIVHGRSYEYDSVGNLESRHRITDSGLDEPESFGYDGLHRLTTWSLDVAVGPDRAQAWEWDPADNATLFDDSLLGSGTPTLIDPLNRYSSFAPIASSLSYFDFGAEQSRALPSGSYQWTWDALGRPHAAIVDGTQTVHFRHDAFDRQVWYADATGSAEFARIGSRILESRSSTEGVREYVHDDNGDVLLRKRGSECLYFHVDPFGNVEALHDASALVESYRFTPFGEPWNPAAPGGPISTVGNDLLFLSAPYHETITMVRLGARLLDPALGRFISPDPLEEAGGVNLYGYGGQNPFRWADPSGLQSCSATTSPTEGNKDDSVDLEDLEAGDTFTSNNINTIIDAYIEMNAEKFGFDPNDPPSFSDLEGSHLEKLQVLVLVMNEIRRDMQEMNLGPDREALQNSLVAINEIAGDHLFLAQFDAHVADWENFSTAVWMLAPVAGPYAVMIAGVESIISLARDFRDPNKKVGFGTVVTFLASKIPWGKAIGGFKGLVGLGPNNGFESFWLSGTNFIMENGGKLLDGESNLPNFTKFGWEQVTGWMKGL